MDPLNQQIPKAPAYPDSTPTVAPVPASPGGAHGIPADMTSADPATLGGLTQDQMKANLQELMSKIEAKMQDFNSQKFSSDNKIKEQESQTLREIFDLFQQNGVDPSNIDEVSAFLQKIKENNPELAQQLESALQSILGDDPAITNVLGNEPNTEGTPSGNMNINTNDQGIPTNV
jgi:transcriptional regulator with AAA-type ATPase domain